MHYRTALEKLAIIRTGELARICGVKPPTVTSWKRGGNYSVPPRHVLALEKSLGLSRYELRPDIFGESPESVIAETTKGGAA